MQLSLLKDCLITRVLNETAAGQTEADTTVLDMQGYDGVLYVVLLGTVTDGSVITATAKENTASSTSSPTPTAVTNGAAGPVTAATSSNKVLVVDVLRQSQRYSFLAITRTVQNAEINGVIAIQYRARSVPVVQALLASALGGPEV